MKKYGLVLAGGGVKGSYEVGAYMALKEMNIDIEGIVGTSIGAINAALFVQDDIEKALKIYKNITIKDIISIGDKELNGNLFDASNLAIIAKEYFKNKGISNDALRKMIEENIDLDKVYNSKKDFGVLTLSAKDMKPVAIFKEDMTQDKMVDYILASACFPVFKRQVIGKDEYVDGGFYDNIPVNMLLHKGYKNLIVVDISGLGLDRKSINKDVYLKVIKPSEDIGGVMDFNKEQIEKNIKLGYLDTMKKFNKLEGHTYFFKSDEFKKMLDVFNLNTIYGLEYAASIYKMDRIRKYTFKEFLQELYNKHRENLKKYESFKENINIWESLKEVKNISGVKSLISKFEEIMDKQLIVCFVTDMYLERPMSKINKYLDSYINCARSMIELEEYMEND